MNAKEAALVLRTMQGKPTMFWEDVLGVKYWAKQEEILDSVWNNPVTAVRSCHGAGKSFSAAGVGLAFLSLHPNSLVITTAPTGRQVKKILWQEWRRMAKNSRRPLGGDLMMVEHRYDDGWYAFGFSTDLPDNFQGLHAEYILVIVDEAAGIDPEIWDAIIALMTSDNARLLAIGNPTDPTGYFASMFKQPNVYKIAISAYDTPNFTTFGITETDMELGTWKDKITGPLPFPSLVTPKWVADRYDPVGGWGRESAMYISRVLGKFPVIANDTIIPLLWVELAQERWHELSESKPTQQGLDVARFGSDETVLATRKGYKLLPLETWRHEDIMPTAGRAKRSFEDNMADCIKIDVIGYGAGVYSRLVEQNINAIEVNVARAPRDPEQYFDLTTELWWHLRDLLNPKGLNPIGLPPDDILANQLASRKYKFTSKGQYRAESKDDMKARGLTSPDRADAAMLAFAPMDAGVLSAHARKLLQGANMYE